LSIDRRLRALALVAAVTLPSLAQAEDVEKRWRLSVALGGFNSLDEVQSNSANELALINRVKFNQGVREVVDFYRDPRDDNSAFGALDVRSGNLGTLAVQYAVTKTFLFEASVGYQVSDVGDIEVQVEFANDPPPIEEVNFNFSTFNIGAGELTRIPVQLDGIFRFRPRAKFNPYIGAGIGYAVIGFEPSQDLNTLSLNIDGNIGSECQVSSSFSANPSMPCGGPVRDLGGIEVDAGDSFEWNVVVGGEVTIKRKMAVFLDLRYVGASRELGIRVDQGSELGVSVPQLVDFDDSIAGVTAQNGGYGAVQIGSPDQTDIGLIDDGYRILVPHTSNPQADCSFPNPNPSCVSQFIHSPGSGFLIQNFKGEIYEDTDAGDGDGRLDPGKYYVQGGNFGWDGLSLQVGFRYTF
jgi:outer membrane protein W